MKRFLCLQTYICSSNLIVSSRYGSFSRYGVSLESPFSDKLIDGFFLTFSFVLQSILSFSLRYKQCGTSFFRTLFTAICHFSSIIKTHLAAGRALNYSFSSVWTMWLEWSTFICIPTLLFARASRYKCSSIASRRHHFFTQCRLHG